jgi:hypothetical protein
MFDPRNEGEGEDEGAGGCDASGGTAVTHLDWPHVAC